MSGRPVGQHRDELVTTATPADVLHGVDVGGRAMNTGSSSVSSTSTSTRNSSNQVAADQSSPPHSGSRESHRAAGGMMGSSFSCEPPERTGIMQGLFSTLRSVWAPSPSSSTVPPSLLNPTALERAAKDAARGIGLAASEGVIRLPRNELLEFPVLVLWRQVLSSAFVLVCDPEDNLVLASNFLSVFVSLLSEKFHNPVVAASPEQFLLHPEVVMELTSKLLPCGQLVFMNPSMAQYVSSPYFQANSYDMAESSDFVEGDVGTENGERS